MLICSKIDSRIMILQSQDGIQIGGSFDKQKLNINPI